MRTRTRNLSAVQFRNVVPCSESLGGRFLPSPREARVGRGSGRELPDQTSRLGRLVPLPTPPLPSPPASARPGQNEGGAGRMGAKIRARAVSSPPGRGQGWVGGQLPVAYATRFCPNGSTGSWKGVLPEHVPPLPSLLLHALRRRDSTARLMAETVVPRLRFSCVVPVMAFVLCVLPGGLARLNALDLKTAVVVSPPNLSGPEGKAVRMLIEEVEKRTHVLWPATTAWASSNAPVILVGNKSALEQFAGPHTKDLH